MNKKNIFVILLCFCFLGLIAQEKSIDTEIREYFEFKAEELVYLFGDNVNVRATPSTKAKVIQTLSVNTEVKIIETLAKEGDEYLTLKGISAPWVKIEFGADKKIGFVWAPLIAQYQIPTPHYTYLFGITKMEENQLYGQLRAIKYGRIWEQKDFKTIGGLAHYTYGKIYGNRGLQNVDSIIELGFGFDACGYTNGYLTFVIEQDAVSYLGKSTSSADSGIVFESNDFIYPTNESEGRPGKIIQKKEIGEFDDIGNGTITTKISVWDWVETKLMKATSG